MRWSFKLFTFAGIGVHIHLTFLLLIGYIFSVHLFREGAALAVQGTALILSVFLCVLAHEFGHALMARRFGVKTKNIVLLPIGGVAQLERIPKEPKQEFLITVAGPLVNVVIACAILAFFWSFGWSIDLEGELLVKDVSTPALGLAVFLRQLLEINIFMVVFNLIPAFPMDGGRILRSTLAAFLDHNRATRIAARVGQILAFGFGFLGLASGNWLLLLIAVFVFLGAAGEASASQLQEVFRGLPISMATIRDFRTLSMDDTLSHAVDLLLGGAQIDFPVLDGPRVVGILTRQQLVNSLRQKGPDTFIREVSLTEVRPVEADAPLASAWEELTKQGSGCLPVERGGVLVGWITSDNIAEVVMVRDALTARAAR
jgi:Zn-dependent protease/CBS domain-containing protein